MQSIWKLYAFPDSAEKFASKGEDRNEENLWEKNDFNNAGTDHANYHVAAECVG